MFETIALAVALFVSTDVDDLFVLVAFFADSRLRLRDIVIGQYVGIFALFAVGYFLSFGALVIPADYVGLLGLVPIAIGVRKLIDREDEDVVAQGPGGALAVALTTAANGGDNIAVYTPVFATQGKAEVAVMAATFVGMTGLWLALAHALTRHRAIGAPIRRSGRWVVPIVLILLGGSIFYRAGSFRLLPF